MITLLIVDDHSLVCTAIAKLLSSFPDIKVIGEVNSGEEAVKIAKDKKPDVILMDIRMPGIGGIKAIEKILASNPSIKIIALSAYTGDPLPAALLKAGIRGYLTKEASIEETVKAIRTVAAGKIYLEPRIAQQLALKSIPGSNSSTVDSLSARELDFMIKVVSGIDIQTIAEKLCVSSKTINSYRYRIYEKLNIKNDVELTLFAIRHGLLNEEGIKNARN